MAKRLPPWLQYDARYHRQRRSMLWTRRLERANVLTTSVGLLVVVAVIIVKLVG